MQTVLSFDFGHKKIGLAVGNSLTRSASELTTISCKNHVPDWHQLDKLIDEWAPDLLVIGLPLNLDGSTSQISMQARAFGKQLKARYNLPIEYEDERLSSNQADGVIRESLENCQTTGKKLLSKRDQVAARLILESYFNRHE